MNSKTSSASIPFPKRISAKKTLDISAVFWFLVAVVGQWLFVYYIALAYGGTALDGNLEAWGNTSLKGHVTGDTTGNWFFASHVLMAAIITFGGTLQLVPKIRNRFRLFHRLNGRLFIFTAFAMALGGLYLVWVRDSTTTLTGAIGVSLNGILIMLFAALAIRTARSRRFEAHRKWALRAYFMVNGVWFFRVGFMAWIMLNQGPLWSTDNLDGPFDLVWAFANYLLPLAILEVYFRAQNNSKARVKFAMAATLFVLTIIMGVGIFAAFMFMWQPNF